MNGKATYISTARDISSRKEAESLLRTGRQRLHDVIEETPAGYFFIDQNGRFQHVNRAWLTMHGYSALEEVAGADFSLTQTEADLKAVETWWPGSWAASTSKPENSAGGSRMAPRLSIPFPPVP